MKRLGILISGRGSNFLAIADSIASGKLDAEIAVVTVGFGTEGGATIPVRAGGLVAEKRDVEGRVVTTRYDPTLLRNVANAAGGEFIAANETDKGTRIRQALTRVDARQRDVAEGLSRPLQVTWFLVPAALLLLLDAWRADGGSFNRVRRMLHLISPLLLIVASAGRVESQSGTDAMEHFKAGQYLRAVQLWRREITNGDKRPSTLFNFGSALLAADSLEPAVEALTRAAQSQESLIRERALYNLGLAQLRRGLRAEAGDQRPIDEAISTYRTLLLQRPDDADAKWNYELALVARKQQRGGGAANNQSQPRQPQPREQADESKAMSRQQADQLLSAASRDEREAMSKRQRGTRQERPPGGKDW